MTIVMKDLFIASMETNGGDMKAKYFTRKARIHPTTEQLKAAWEVYAILFRHRSYMLQGNYDIMELAAINNAMMYVARMG